MRGRLAGLGVAAAVTALAVAGGATGASASPGKTAAVRSAGAVGSASSVSAPAATAAYTPPTRTLKEGMKGADVKALQLRLAALKYYPGPADGSFGNDTLEAVWAFQEVQGLTVDGVVGAVTGRALVNPRTYRANDPRQAATRVEVNLKMGVLVFFKNRNISLISHVSSGGHYYFCEKGSGCNHYAYTPTGKFQALYLIKGWHRSGLGLMYNPVYFNYDGYAIHGDTSVPVKPVSHGCVRIPMDIASWFYTQLAISQTPGKGTPIWIYN